MVAGPQILSAIFLATSEEWQRNSASFIVGATASISLITAIAYTVGEGTTRGERNDTLLFFVIILLVVAMIYVYRRRERTEPPKWMGTLQTATPRFSFRLGFLLLGFFPTNILTATTVGSTLSGTGAPLVHSLPFLSLTVLFISLPSLALFTFGERAEASLPTVREWMNTHSWIVNEVVLIFFLILTANNLVG